MASLKAALEKQKQLMQPASRYRGESQQYRPYKLTHTLRGHQYGVTSLPHLGPDQLASGSADKTVKIWERDKREKGETAVTGEAVDERREVVKRVSLRQQPVVSAQVMKKGEEEGPVGRKRLDQLAIALQKRRSGIEAYEGKHSQRDQRQRQVELMTFKKGEGEEERLTPPPPPPAPAEGKGSDLDALHTLPDAPNEIIGIAEQNASPISFTLARSQTSNRKKVSKKKGAGIMYLALETSSFRSLRVYIFNDTTFKNSAPSSLFIACSNLAK